MPTTKTLAAAFLFASASLVSLVAMGQAAPPVKPAKPASPALTLDKIAFFETKIRPVLQANCFSCHGGGKEGKSGGLDMSSRAALLKGGSSGPIAVLGKPSADSLLMHAVRYQDREMPPSGKLPQEEIDALAKWVDMGMPWPDAKPAAKDGAIAFHGPPPVNAQTKKWWSFVPVKAIAPPVIKGGKAWVNTPMDAFVLAKLQAMKLHPNPPASRAALLRRVTYDLIGLPPTPEETRAFLADKSPNAYSKVVDRLLASPKYGEKWARHWLDLVRYAETNSFERDDPKPFAWRYRDYVIDALNSDKPYNQFVREQLAGDEMPGAGKDGLIATGYYRLGQWDDEPSDPLQAKYDEFDDITNTTGQAFLGLTVGCARCHDHKIDPIPTKDYYSMMACFAGVTHYGVRGYDSVVKNSLRSIAPPDEQARFDKEKEAYQTNLADIEKQLKAIEDIATPTFTPVEKEDFNAQQNKIPLIRKRKGGVLTDVQVKDYVRLMGDRRELTKNPPRGLEMALCVTEDPKPDEMFVALRGNPHVPGDKVEPGFLSVLSAPAPKITPGANSSGRRLALADWITDPKNPLTARVIVNRVWQHHFGRGIVRTPNNFGFGGSAPTHPELLDYLANRFVQSGWKLKPLHRMMVLSSTYQMAATAQTAGLKADPENDLMWRFDPRRLDGEELRDSVLTVCGNLNLKAGGPSIYPEIPREVLAGQSRPGYGWPVSEKDEQNRRSIYVHIKRSLTVPILAAYDGPDLDTSCPVRFATTQPTQALTMLNSQWMNEQAGLWADQLQKASGDGEASRAKCVRLALVNALQREPTQTEITRGTNLIARLRKQNGALSERDGLRMFCLVALNLNEFVYLD